MPVNKLIHTSDEPAAVIVEQWRRAGPALAKVRHRELRELGDQEALAAARQLLDLLPVVPANDTTTGLLEQQRLFTLSRQ